MTNYLFDRGTGIDVVLVSCARRPAEIICRRRLELMASRVPTIKLHFIVEQDDPYDVWTGYRGRLNQVMLGLIASDYLEREVYCCGPEPFMQAVRDMLIALGFDMEHYHQESFAHAVETEADAPELDDFVPDEAKSAELVFADVGRDGGLQRDRHRAGGRQGGGPEHPQRLQLRRLRHLQGPEALRRGAHGAQRRHLGRTTSRRATSWPAARARSDGSKWRSDRRLRTGRFLAGDRAAHAVRGASACWGFHGWISRENMRW